jgi:hypothetical protein
MILQMIIGILVFLHPLLQPFQSIEANIIETITLLSLMALATFNVASSSRVSGGADPRNDILDQITVALLLIPFIAGCIIWIYDKWRATKGANTLRMASSLTIDSNVDDILHGVESPSSTQPLLSSPIPLSSPTIPIDHLLNSNDQKRTDISIGSQ